MDSNVIGGKPGATATARHLGHLDGLRALAAVYVMLGHAFLQVNFRHQRLSDLEKGIFQVFFFGHYAVDLFIVLSGFCLMLPIVTGDGTLRGGTLNFLKRRAWRILPPYYAAMGMSLFLIWLCIGQKTGTHWDISIPVTGKSILTHFILMQDGLGDESNINHVFWSISVEWRIYFLFPSLVFLWMRFGPVTITSVAMVCSYVLFNVCVRYFGNPFAAHYIGLFVLGMFGAAVAFPVGTMAIWLNRLPWSLITGFLTLVVFLMLFPRMWDGPLTRVYVADYIVGAWSASLLIAASSNEQGWIARVLRYRPMVFIGTFAYSIYLIHAPLLQVLWQYPFAAFQNRPLVMFAALTLVGAPLIVGASYVFFLCFERPFLRMGKKRNQDSLAVATVLQPAP